MKWTTPENSKNRVDTAAKILSGRKPSRPDFGWNEAFSVVANWRSAHRYPMQVFGMTLRRRVHSISKRAVVPQRSKRIPSIIAKLRRFPSMQLTQMQDLGGCRAIVPNIKQVAKLVEIYEKRPCSTARLIEKYDYIAAPKPDGYRGVHFVYEYVSGSPKRSAYNGMRVEIQFRTRYQHAWATALETIDVFTNQALKSGIGAPDWKRFFLLASYFISVIEESPLPEATFENVDNPVDEFCGLCEDLKIIHVLNGIGSGLSAAPEVPAAAVYILILNASDRTTHVLGFDNEESAAKHYEEVEKETASNSSVQAVMVSVESVVGLRQAYPNYYMDTKSLIRLIQIAFAVRNAKRDGREVKEVLDEMFEAKEEWVAKW